MKITPFLLFALLALSACDKMQASSNQALDMTEERTSSSWRGFRHLLDLDGNKKDPTPHSQQRYCYKLMEDVICYANPRPGEDERLTGYQDSHGNTGYVIPPPAAPVAATTTTTIVTVPAPAPVVVTNTSAPKKASKAKKVKTTVTTVTVPDSPPVASVPAGKSIAPASDAVVVSPPKKPLKEVIFDPAELQPKQLVPDKMQ